tara:strand:- start:632 stop:835 length:204 start_codon:yes stop_codon:yes gene_type:complete
MTQEMPWKHRKSLSEITHKSGHPLPFNAGYMYDFGGKIGIRSFLNDTEALSWYIREVKARPELLKDE